MLDISDILDQINELFEARGQYRLDDDAAWISLIAHYLDLREIHEKARKGERSPGIIVNPETVRDPETGENLRRRAKDDKRKKELDPAGFAEWRGIEPGLFNRMLDKYEVRAEKFRKTQAHKMVLRKITRPKAEWSWARRRKTITRISPEKRIASVKVAASYLTAKEANPSLTLQQFADQEGMKVSTLRRHLTYTPEAEAYRKLIASGEQLEAPKTRKKLKPIKKGAPGHVPRSKPKPTVKLYPTTPEPVEAPKAPIRRASKIGGIPAQTPKSRSSGVIRRADVISSPTPPVEEKPKGVLSRAANAFLDLFKKTEKQPQAPKTTPKKTVPIPKTSSNEPSAEDYERIAGEAEARKITASPEKQQMWNEIAKDVEKTGYPYHKHGSPTFHSVLMDKWIDKIVTKSASQVMREKIFNKILLRTLKALGKWNPGAPTVATAAEAKRLIYSDPDLETLDDLVTQEVDTYVGRIRGTSEKSTARRYRKEFVKQALDFGYDKARIARYLVRDENYLDKLMQDPTTTTPKEAKDKTGTEIDGWALDRKPRVFVIGVLNDSAVPSWLKKKFDVVVQRGGVKNIKDNMFTMKSIRRRFKGELPDVVIVATSGISPSKFPHRLPTLRADATKHGVTVLGIDSTRQATSISGILSSAANKPGLEWLKESLLIEALANLFETTDSVDLMIYSLIQGALPESLLGA